MWHEIEAAGNSSGFYIPVALRECLPGKTTPKQHVQSCSLGRFGLFVIFLPSAGLWRKQGRWPTKTLVLPVERWCFAFIMFWTGSTLNIGSEVALNILRKEDNYLWNILHLLNLLARQFAQDNDSEYTLKEAEKLTNQAYKEPPVFPISSFQCYWKKMEPLLKGWVSLGSTFSQLTDILYNRMLCSNFLSCIFTQHWSQNPKTNIYFSTCLTPPKKESFKETSWSPTLPWPSYPWWPYANFQQELFILCDW